ncbi:phage holin, lambda family [Rosenbergiella epipactidis]|uniref:phage holin, lambda family n=1 Tax=Rosenbergiella epipactidis TaxID=1544694 RepID=UPI001F4DD392|nr:phage holin, lambda family [Rosenbergiella epipactidis]
MKMNNDPHTVSEWGRLLHSWWSGDTPVGAVIMAVVMSALRIAYTSGGWKKMLLEGLLCGALTLTFASAFEYLNLPKTLSVGIGGAVGFIGVDSIRAFAMRFIGNKLGDSNGQH